MAEVRLERFDFDPWYSLQADPEFPGDGHWPCPVFGFGRDGAVDAEFQSRWGTPAVYLIETREGAKWVGMFAAGGLGGVTGVFACPANQMLCIVVDGLAYLVNVEAPSSGALIAHDQVYQVVPAVSPSLLLLVRFIDIVAIDAGGIAWKSDRLCVDDLRVEAVTQRTIICTGENLGGSPTIEVDPHTGVRIGGAQLPIGWPADS